MGKQDWCSSKGLNARKKGMYKKESKSTKCCYLAVFCLSAIIYIVIGSLHGNRSENAEKINKDFESFTSEPKAAYDGCNIPNFIPDATPMEIFELSVDYEESCRGKE